MADKISMQVTNRRTLLIEGARAIAGIGALIALGSGAVQAGEKKWQKAMDKVLNGAVPSKKHLVLTMPEIAENGNVVPITLNAEAATNDKVYVREIRVFATDNPLPQVAHFIFSENSGKAEVTSRMRLAKSQKVIALATLSDGKHLIGETFVKVTIGGCGG